MRDVVHSIAGLLGWTPAMGVDRGYLFHDGLLVSGHELTRHSDFAIEVFTNALLDYGLSLRLSVEPNSHYGYTLVRVSVGDLGSRVFENRKKISELQMSRSHVPSGEIHDAFLCGLLDVLKYITEYYDAPLRSKHQ